MTKASSKDTKKIKPDYERLDVLEGLDDKKRKIWLDYIKSLNL